VADLLRVEPGPSRWIPARSGRPWPGSPAARPRSEARAWEQVKPAPPMCCQLLLSFDIAASLKLSPTPEGCHGDERQFKSPA
jgi:hypothetical protein